MRSKTEEPKTVEQHDGHYGKDGNIKTTHPCFGMIGASRVNGHQVLFGSDFIHHASVRIRIQTCELNRHLATDWPHAVQEIVEVELSEAQWATFVSSMNVGDGVQCTLRAIQGEGIPELPFPETREKQHMNEAKAMIERASTEIDELKTMIEGLKVPKKTLEALLSKADGAKNQFASGAPFVIERYAEHMEKTKEKAKIEINAYATKHLIQTGLAALTAKPEEQFLQLPDAKGDEQNG